ncbi:hypothetical protein BGZ49_004001 [Haplosporangium sp. Z 27]|nr:hypothetical protein BGZ49_004001 [Haplosporangium sp. Z 27]
MELSTLRLRLKQFERSSTVREKRMSFFQQQTSDTQQSLQATTYQFESTISRLQDTEQRLEAAKVSLSQNEEIVHQLEKTTHDQKCKLDEILSERESLAAEMKDSYAENVKLQKRLKTSTEKVEKLQQENRQLIEQLQNIRHGSTENHDSKSRIGDQAIIEIEKEVNKNKTEVDRLQNLVLMMSNRHVQVQAQLTFFQQQAQQLQLQLDQSHQESTSDRLNYNNDNNTPVPHWANSTTTATTTTTTTARKHGSLMMDESTLSSLLTSVASVAATSHSRRTKPTRRYTVNAPRKDGELTLEQRKCEFLMDQISVLQRGYDALRQEKVTLELQIDLMQRQHQYHQQQRQKRRESQRRTLGQEQSKALSNALAIMVTSSPVSPGPLSAIPSTPLLPTISAAEQEKEKARIQYELEQAQIKAQQEAQEREAQRLAAKAAAEEAEKEAIRLKRAKSLHLKETLASLESKRDRTDSRNILFSKSEELKHLEHFRLANDLQQSDFRSSTDSTKNFSNAAAIRASRRVASPFSPGARSSSNASSPLSSSSPSPFSAITTPSPLSSHSSQEKQLAKYTHSSKNQQALHHLPSHAYKIEQCSCCLGAMIEL